MPVDRQAIRHTSGGDHGTQRHFSNKGVADWAKTADSAPARRSSKSAKPSTSKLSSPAKQTYTVRSGDSLWSVVNRFGLPIEELSAWNHDLASSALQPGQQRLINPTAATAVSLCD
ncbi:MAG: LysM peptidoglycan-binding domain-containing protein [Chromatiales bacterium]|nr:LysM peptidoglycan-binding domain-containing protein [Chromatiales bacterium]